MSDITMTPPISMPLTAVDRCDRCGAAAKVRAILPAGGELLFCRHHYNSHDARLAELSAIVEDSAAELV